MYMYLGLANQIPVVYRQIILTVPKSGCNWFVGAMEEAILLPCVYHLVNACPYKGMKFFGLEA